MAPIATNTNSPALIQAEELETAAQCTLWIPGRWAGPATPEVQWSAARDHYYILFYIITHYIVILQVRSKGHLVWLLEAMPPCHYGTVWNNGQLPLLELYVVDHRITSFLKEKANELGK